MSGSQLIPFLMVVFCNVAYHLASKNVPKEISPFLGLMGTYGASFLCCTALYFLTRHSSLDTGSSKISLFNLLLGLAVVGVEGGYLLLYRSGSEVGKAPMMASICFTVTLAILGVLFFRETMTASKAAGILLCIVGIVLMNR